MMKGTFRSYSKIDPYLQFRHETKQKERRRILIIVSASVFLIVAVVGLTAGLVIRNKHNSQSSSAGDGAQFSTGSAAIQAACTTTLYPQTCTQTLSSYPGALSANPLELVAISVKVAMEVAEDAQNLSVALSQEQRITPMEQMTFQDCAELMQLALDEFNASLAQLSTLSLDSLNASLQSVELRLSSASSQQTACVDGLDLIAGNSSASIMASKQEYVSEVTLNALGLVQTLASLGTNIWSWKRALNSLPDVHLRRRLLSANGMTSSQVRIMSSDGNITPLEVATIHMLDAGELPSWLSPEDRRLLLEAPAEAPSGDSSHPAAVAADMVVDINGNGDFINLTYALESVPEVRSGRFVILVKAGVYNEGPLTIKLSLQALTLIGEGCGKTIISGDANVASGMYTTYRSATIGVSAQEFIAKYITFRNTAGPNGYQAVALRSNAEKVVFQGCCFEGYQDTLYALSGQQFFWDCTITGTVDIIFGNALALFDGCQLAARQPREGQSNTYTAQGRKQAILKTGFSFQRCSLSETNELGVSSFPVSTFLGRPWKEYSRTVFLESYIGAHVSDLGWLPWNASDPFETTCFYGEYANTGPGSVTSERVTWPCVHPALSVDEAQQYTVQNFLDGGEWIPLTSNR